MPPNEPATPGTDRLFETGCCLCGDVQGACTRLMDPFSRDKLCMPCVERYAPGCADRDWNAIRAEITRRRKSAPSPAFKPGDRVTALDAFGTSGDPVEGRYLGPSSKEPGFSVIDREDGKGWIARIEGEPYDCQDAWHVTRSSLKPAPAPVEMWGSCPPDDELPSELPAGSRAKEKSGLGDDLSHFRLSSDRKYYTRESLCISADGVNWGTVPRPSQKAVPAQAERDVYPPLPGVTCDACGGPAVAYRGLLDRLHERSIAGHRLCKECWPRTSESNAKAAEARRAKPPEPGQSPPDPYAGYDLNAWGQPRDRRGEAAAELQAKYRVPYAGRMDEQRIPGFPVPLDSRIASARQSTEREAGVKQATWDCEDVDYELSVS